MAYRLTTISVVLFVATVVNLFVGVLSWQRRKTQSGIYFALGAFALTFWTLFAGLDYAAATIAGKVFFAKLEYIAYNTALSLFVFFTIHYAHYEERLDTRSLTFLLLLLPLSNILLAFTNDLHGLLWSSFSWSETGENIALFHHGPAFAWVVGTGYLQILFILLGLWSAYRRSVGMARKQARLLFGAALLPALGNLLYLFNIKGIQGIDWSSILFTISGMIFIFALYGMSFLDVVPIARNALLAKLRDGLIVLNTNQQIVEINPVMADMLGRKQSELIGLKLVDLLPAFQPYLATRCLDDVQGELSIEIDQKRYLEFFISALTQDTGEGLGCLIIMRDITVRKQDEIFLRQRTEAVEQSPMTVVVTDMNGTITYVNPQFTFLTGFSAEEAIGKKMNIIRSEHTPDSVYKDMWQTILSGNTWRGEILNKKKNGELYWEWTVIAPVKNGDEENGSFIAVKENITERKRAEEALKQANQRLEKQLREIQKLQADLREQAIRDPLTKLYNRRFLVDVLEREFSFAKRRGKVLSILILDIDHFKLINDTYGHHIGDQCLIGIAELLKDFFREADIVCRFGGEEFLVVLPDSASEFTMQRAEDFRKQVEETTFSFDEHEISVTISIGVASYPEHGESSQEIIQKADHALYDAKHQGRNRVVLCESS